jgi:hypothetical protein
MVGDRLPSLHVRYRIARNCTQKACRTIKVAETSAVNTVDYNEDDE